MSAVTLKALRADWLPAVALSAALALALVVWDPRVGDLAAQVFRAELFERGGLAIWNGSWYGGHYTLTYSVLFPPLAALLTPRIAGLLAVVASAYLFDRLVEDRWGAAARPATLWFAAGVVTLLADGQLPFALGVALALASLRCLQTAHPAPALVAAAACPLASPVAGAFLAGVIVAALLARREQPPLAPVAVAAVALALTVVPSLAFPEAGEFPFAFTSYLAIPLWCAAALLITRGLGETELRWAVACYLLAATVIWLLPNPMGGNAVRLGALFGGPVLAAVLLARRPPVPLLAIGLVLLGSLYWQLTASVREIARSVGDPSTQAAYFEPASSWLLAHGGRHARVEVPPTANHWEAAYLAPRFELARGWLRQLDTTREEIFYERPLTHRAYRAWLRDGAVSYVALPDADLDYSAKAERRLILQRPPYLVPRWHSEHWRVYEVRDPAPLVKPLDGGRARATAVGQQAFSLEVSRPGEFLVRVNHTPYWAVAGDAGCVTRRGEWTAVRAFRSGTIRVKADFSLLRAWRALTGTRSSC